MKKRICSVCGKEKSLDEFYRHRGRKYGRSYYCKTCGRERARIRNAKPEYIRKNKIFSKTKRGIETRRKRQRRDYWINRHKYTAKKMVAAMIKSGDIVRKPCVECGEEKSFGHHSDYAKPLEVIWLCQKHHSEVHRKIG